MGLGPATLCPEERVPPPVSFHLTLVHYSLIASIGFYSFLATGTNHHIYLFWYSLFRSFWHRKWSDAYEILTMNEKKKRRQEALKAFKPSLNREMSSSSTSSNNNNNNNVNATTPFTSSSNLMPVPSD